MPRADLQRSRDLAARKVFPKQNSMVPNRSLSRGRNVDQMRSMITKKEVRAPSMGSSAFARSTWPNGQSRPASCAAHLARSHVCRFRAAHSGFRNYDGLEVRVRTDALPAAICGQSDGDHSTVDTVTRNVSIQGTPAKCGSCAAPGMFARIESYCRKSSRLGYSRTAVAYAPYGDSVFVIEKRKIKRPERNPR